MMPQRMVKVQVVGSKSVMEKVVAELYALKAVHISEASELELGKPFASAERLSELLVAARSAAAFLRIKLGKPSRRIGIAEAGQKLDVLSRSVGELAGQEKALSERLKSLAQLESELSSLAGLGIGLEDLKSCRSVSVFVGRLGDKSVDARLGSISDRVAVVRGDGVLAVFVEAAKAREVQEFLASEGFADIPVPEGLKGTAAVHIERFAAERQKLLAEQSGIAAGVARLREKWADFIVSAEWVVAAELEKAEAPLRFGTSRNIFVVTGFVPEQGFGTVRQRLERVSEGRVSVSCEEVGPHDKVPVRLNNVAAASPFELLIGLRGLPLYDEIDPTLIVFLTFPVFFGFMLGDIGYGLVTLAMVLLLRMRLGRAALLDVLLLGALSSVVFGFVFGEFFGEEQFFGISIPHLLSRAHAEGRQALFLAAIAFGVLHVNLGLALGFVNELRHGFVAAFMEKFSWVFIQLGAPFILSSLGIFQVPQPFVVLSAGSLAAGVFMLVLAELRMGAIGGVKALVESIGIFSNILSYARLMAVGLASVQLALIVNEFAGEMFHAGGFAVVGGVIMLLLGHTINILLGLLGSFLHSLRLEYVEFFTKFYKGGSEPFRPFGEREVRMHG
ncbi:V-type ATP synthase subunit I [Candidatus Woesearchaeota archaeon]|nr:V-type ATP synthase subunit I [Candidatus Woesearchaeota archaeon]